MCGIEMCEKGLYMNGICVGRYKVGICEKSGSKLVKIK